MDVEILGRPGRRMWHMARRRPGPWGFGGLVDGFGQSLAEELDYRIEMDNMAALRASLGRHGIRIPGVHEELSGRRIIVMERFDGVPVGKAADLLAALPAETRKETASKLLDAVLT